MTPVNSLLLTVAGATGCVGGPRVGIWENHMPSDVHTSVKERETHVGFPMANSIALIKGEQI